MARGKQQPQRQRMELQAWRLLLRLLQWLLLLLLWVLKRLQRRAWQPSQQGQAPRQQQWARWLLRALAAAACAGQRRG